MLSNTNREWLYADMGILGAGGVSNGIYPTDAPAQVEYLCSDSATVYLFVEDDEQLDKALEVRARLPTLRKIIVFDMDGLREFDDPQVMSLDALRALGREHDAAHPGEWERRVALRKADDLAVLIYTSGTTGRPKGAMLSHANLLVAPRSSIPTRSSSTRTTSACASCRCATWPSASSASTRRSSPARGSISSRTPRPCRKTCARSRPRCSARCRASGRSSIRWC